MQTMLKMDRCECKSAMEAFPIKTRQIVLDLMLLTSRIK